MIYGVGNILVYAAGFLLLPVYIRCLSREEYGLLDIFQRCGEILTLCLLYNGLRQALFTFHNQAESDYQKRAAIGSVLFLAALFLSCGGFTMILFADVIGDWLGIEQVQLLRLAIVAVLLETFAMLLLALAQARVESTFFVIMTLVQFSLRIILAITFVVCWQWGIRGVLLASAVASSVSSLILLIRECRNGLALDFSQFKSMMWFAIPFVPCGLCFFVLNSGDRFFLLKYVSRAELGAYALGYKLALLVKLFSRQPLGQVWAAKKYQVAKQPDASVTFGKVFTRILAAYILVGLGLCMISDEVVFLLSKGRYVGSASVILPVVLGYLFFSAADLMDSAFYIHRKTVRKTQIAFCSTIVMLSLYAFLIPRFGILGAAWATTAGFAAHAVITGWISQRVMLVQYEWRRLIAFFLLAACIWALSRLLPSNTLMILPKVLIWTLLPILSWLVGIISKEEKAEVISLWDRLISRFRAKSKGLAPTTPRAMSLSQQG